MNPISGIDGSTTQSSSLLTMGATEESRLESGDLGQDARGGRPEARPTKPERFSWGLGGTGHRPVVVGDPPATFGAPRTNHLVRAMAVPKLGGRLPPRTARLAVPPRSNRIVPARGGRRCLGTIACLVAALWLTGCSTFEQDWQAARLIPRLDDDVAGRWEGTWRSEANGHNDQLRAVITKGSNGVYLTRFHARYKKGIFRFSFGYSVPLQVQRTNDTYQFQGEADLGWLAGGLYRYEGSATGTNFFSTYRCKYDHGTFQMGRPSGSNPP